MPPRPGEPSLAQAKSRRGRRPRGCRSRSTTRTWTRRSGRSALQAVADLIATPTDTAAWALLAQAVAAFGGDAAGRPLGNAARAAAARPTAMALAAANDALARLLPDVDARRG